MASASQSSMIAQLDVINCPICSELLNDPRSLPCIHIFCLKCIEGYSANKQPDDAMPCPVCQKEFIIPKGGLGELPRNSFIEKLLQIKQIAQSRKKSSPCDACEADEDDEDEERGTAVIYCVECREKLCDSCAKAHKKVKISRSHKQISLDDSVALEDELLIRGASPTVCDKHKTQALEVFCRDCKMAICVICYIASHKQHDCADITEVIDKFRQQMTSDINDLVDGTEKLREISKSIEQQKEEFIRKTSETEDDIIKKAEELKQLIERDKQTLLSEMAIKKRNVVKHLETLNQEVKQQISSIDNLKKYSEELKSKGAASDVARDTAAVHERAVELLNIDTIERSRYNMDRVLVKFTPSTVVSADVANIMGKIIFEDEQPCSLTLVQTIPTSGHSIVGVASLDKRLLVARQNAQSQNIHRPIANRRGIQFAGGYQYTTNVEEYDSSTFVLQRNIPVANLQTPYGLAACGTNNCVYVSDYSTGNIHRIELLNYSVTAWSSKSQNPAGLFVNKANNVIVTSNGSHMLYEYNTHGSLLRRINLQPAGITSPWYALQLSDDQFVVSYQNHVCVVNIDGQILGSFGSQQAGSGTDQLNTPIGLVLVRNDCILIADCNNKRIIMLNSYMGVDSARVLHMPDGCALQDVHALDIDEERGRLFVAEYGGGRVLVLDNVYNACRSIMYNAVFIDKEM